MTEDLLQRLEDKMVAICSELEEARKEILRLTTDLNTSKQKEEANMTKLQGLIGLLDTVGLPEVINNNNTNLQALKPVLVQG